MKKTGIARTISLSMAIMMAFSSFAWAESSAIKEETVYVNLSHQGKVENITVSDWLHSEDMDVEFDDVSTLKGIKNVKGEEKPFAKGGSLKWKTDKGEIYYQGKTDKKLPLEFEISYMLDGEKISPELLAGANGRLQIKMEITNTEANEVMLSSGKKVLYTPFAVATVFNFPTDDCRNVTVNTGKILNDGNKTIVTYASVPGLKESLDIDNEDFDDIFDVPEYLIIEADVSDFEMEDIMITAEADSSIMDDIEDFDDVIDETIDGVKDLTDASEEVQDGIEILNDGTGELLSKFGDFSSGMMSLKENMSFMEENINGKIIDGSMDLSEGVEEFKEKTDELKDGSEELYDGSEDLMDGLKEAYSGASDLKSGSTQLTEGIEQLIAVAGSDIDTAPIEAAMEAGVKDVVEKAINDAIIDDGTFTPDQKASLKEAAMDAGIEASGNATKVVEASLKTSMVTLNDVLNGQLLPGAVALEGGIGSLQTGIRELLYGSEDLYDGMKELDDNAELFQTGASDLYDGANDLSEGLEALGDGAAALKEGVDGLADATETANDGIDALQKGTEDLAEGYDTFSDEGIDELNNETFEKTDSYHEIFEIKDHLSELATRYNNFSGISENMDGKVKFVIKIDNIEVDAIEEEILVVEDEKVGFVDWVKNTWNKMFNK